MTPELRVQTINSRDVDRGGQYVLYWMIAQRRSEWNFGLQRAAWWGAELNKPVLVGISRKSMIGNLLGREVDERLAGSISAATVSMLKGACIIRVHDVKESVDAARVVSALNA